MRNIKFSISAILTALLIVFMFSCQYDEILPPEPPDDVTFSGNILPIFNQSCNSAGCHSGGSADFPPNLAPSFAYQSLQQGGYIDTITPENSLLYRWMIGNEGIPMPTDGTNSFYNATVLKWIELGAKEN